MALKFFNEEGLAKKLSIEGTAGTRNYEKRHNKKIERKLKQDSPEEIQTCLNCTENKCNGDKKCMLAHMKK